MSSKLFFFQLCGGGFAINTHKFHHTIFGMCQKGFSGINGLFTCRHEIFDQNAHHGIL